MEWRQGIGFGQSADQLYPVLERLPVQTAGLVRGFENEIDVLLMSAHAPLLSVVIVNCNGEPFLRGCLHSLSAALANIHHELILVDNASTDASCEVISREFPGVRLLRSEQHLGAAGGSNLGVRHARGELLLLLSPDTQCMGSLSTLIAVMKDRSVGVAGCMLRQADGRVRPSVGFEHTPSRVILSWLGFAGFSRVLRCFKRVESNIAFYEHYRSEVDWIAGACLLTRRSLWKRLGGFDEDFFTSCEEIDYCRRVRLAGYSVTYAPAVAVMYYEGLARTRAFETTLLSTSRAYLLYMSKHFGNTLRTGVGLSLGAVFLARGLCYAVGALDRANSVAREKFRAYVRAAGFLVGASVGLRNPETRL